MSREREVCECKACGCINLQELKSNGKEFLVCQECGQVHRVK
jgi:uncharacterized Zn finger protein